LEINGPPPKIIWITAGNTSNNFLKELLKRTLLKAIHLLETGENIVEINNLA
jgi:predicted nuclease of predicted toxin-antitoxin system